MEKDTKNADDRTVLKVLTQLLPETSQLEVATGYFEA